MLKAQQAGYIKGLGNFQNIGDIFNLHFVDDILLFLEAKVKYIEALKWILVGFEDISSLKINYNKCEMIPLNISKE